MMNSKIKCNASPIFRARPFAGLGDFQNESEADIRTWIREQFREPLEKFAHLDILLAYWSGSDYEETAWFLLRDRATGVLLEVHGSHCSCYGFEEQWSPEETTLEYLKSDKFSFSAMGSDAVKEAKTWIQANL